MKKSLIILAFLFAFGCQTEEQITIKPREELPAATSATNGKKSNPTNARIGGHPYWYFYRSQSTTHLRYAYSDNGVTWSGDQMFGNNIGSTTSPAAVIFNSKLYCIYKGGGSHYMYFSSSPDGVSWQPNTKIPGVTTLYAPTAVVVNGYIYVFYVRVTASDIYYVSTPDGVTWSTPKAISVNLDKCDGTLTASLTPSGAISLYYSSNKELRYRISLFNAISNGNVTMGPYNWLHNYNDEIIKTDAGVGVTWKLGDDGDWTEYVAYKHPDNGRLNIYKAGYLHWGEVFWTGAYTSNNPSIVYFDNKFTMVYKSLSSGAILRATSTDGTSWLSNYAAKGQTTSGGPRMVVEE